MKSIKQTFGILIVALALFGAYSLLCPKKPVDDSVSDDFRAELAEKDGIFLNDSEDTGGKSVLFNTLGNFPALPSLAQIASGTSTNSAPPALFSEDVSAAPKYGQTFDDDLDLHIPSEFDAPAWDEPLLSVPQIQQNTPEIPEFPLLEVPVFDDAPLFDVPATMQAEPAEHSMTEFTPEVTLTPMISMDSLNSWDILETVPSETLDSLNAFTPIDPTTPVLTDFMEVLPKTQQESFEWADPIVAYDQRVPEVALNHAVPPLPDPNVRPLPLVTEGAMTLASGVGPNSSQVATDHSASTEDFLFSNPVSDLSATELKNTQDASNFADFSDFSTPAFETTSASTAPGIARSSQRREAPAPTPVPASLQATSADSFSPMQNVAMANPTVRNPISQSTPRPEVLQRINQIKNILNDETKEYRLGHQMITELYMADLNFAERELVLPIAAKCGWAAFFSSRSFDPYDWSRAISPTDTIQSLAAQNGISPELILKINLLDHPGQLFPGKENVKIPKGPFDATIFLDRKEMVITARGLFACRFRIGIGSPEIITEGVYQIENKFPNPRYLGELGEIDSGDPRNPLGTHWIGLDQEIGIHGTNTPSCLGTDNAPVEGFSLDNRDIAEVYDMLTPESRITVRK